MISVCLSRCSGGVELGGNKVEFRACGCLYSKVLKDDAGKAITYLHGLTNDNAELLVIPGQKRGEFILSQRPVPRPKDENDDGG